MALFGMKSKYNHVYSLLQVFQTLLLYPCFMVRNPYNYGGSSLSRLLDCKKDVFYRFMSHPGIDWRKLLYHLNIQLWSKIRVRSRHKSENTCLIVDDTTIPKPGGVLRTSDECIPMYRTVVSLDSRPCFLPSQTVNPN